jgi:SAM-dependent methyltransferase
MMEARLQRRIQRYGWDKAAGYYEPYWSGQLAPAQRRLVEIADPRPGERVLDVACGTGLISLPVAEAVAPGGSMIGTDISERMVEAAAAEAVRRGVRNAAFLRMDAERLDFPDAGFHLVLCSLGLMYLPDAPAALREMLRVLKPGGRAAALVWGERSRCGWAEIFPVVDRRVESEVCPLFFQLGAGDTLAHAFTACGFADVAAGRLRTLLRYDSAGEACGAAFAGGPVALAYSRFDPRVRDEAHAEYLASIEPYRNGSGYSIPGEFVIVTGRAPGGEIGGLSQI